MKKKFPLPLSSCKSTVFTYSPSLLSGFLIGTSYIPFPPWALFFCLLPLWSFWLGESSLKKIFIAGWLSQFVLTLIGFHWVAHTTSEFGRMPPFISFGVLLLFSSLAHLHYPLSGVFWKWICKKFNLSLTASIIILPIVFALFERLYPFIFFWHLGYPWLWAEFPAIHLTPWIGFFGLNLITLFANALLCLAWVLPEVSFDFRAFFSPVSSMGFLSAFKINQKWRKISFGLTLSVLIGFLILNGAGLIFAQKMKKPNQILRVLVVQGNIGNFEKAQSRHGSGYKEEILNIYTRLTLQGLKQSMEQSKKIDLVIWPETAFAETLTKKYRGPQREILTQISRQFQVPFLIGAFEEENGKYFNSLVLLDGIKPLASYRKTVLLAFGEYLPLSDWFPKLREWFPMVSDLTPGIKTDIQPLTLTLDREVADEEEALKKEASGGEIPHFDREYRYGIPAETDRKRGKLVIGGQICYESLFDQLSSQSQRKKAQVFVNITNDSWFGESFEPQQHKTMTLARAIENRRPLIRATNTGISTVILADGTLLEESPLNKEWFKLFEVPYHSDPQPTFYAKISGNWPWILLLLVGLVVFGDRFVSRKNMAQVRGWSNFWRSN